jgi:hypothetical protein
VALRQRSQPVSSLRFPDQLQFASGRCSINPTAASRAPTRARLASSQRRAAVGGPLSPAFPLRSGGRVSGSGRTPEAASSAAPAPSWACASSLGQPFGVMGFWFGVCGSWSRMRHQRAAAGWSSGSGPAAAADRTRWVASKPARVRLLNLSVSSGRNGSAMALGASMASSCRHCHSVRAPAAASRLSSCCWTSRSARPCWGGSRVAGVDLGGGARHLYVGDQVGRHVSVELSRPGRCFSCGVAADLGGELSNKL